MSVAVSSSRSNGLASWFESHAGPALKPSSTADPSQEFAGRLQEAAEHAASAGAGAAGEGLPQVFHAQAGPPVCPESESRLCLIETAVPKPNTVQAQAQSDGGSPSPADLKGVFRDVPEDSIEPLNTILFWRRPDNPPPIAWQSKLALAEAVRRAGYDPKDFAVSYWETKGEWPGGMMVIRELTLVAPDGRKVDLSADMVAGCVEAAVEDVRRFMTETVS